MSALVNDALTVLAALDGVELTGKQQDAVTRAAGPGNSDAARGAGLLATDTSIGDQQIDVLADSAYASGDMLAELTAAAHTAIIKPMPLARAVPGGFTIDDFTIDHTTATMTCPAGVTRPVAARGTVTFGAACSSCPLRARCTTAARGRKITVTAYDRIKREHRTRAQEPGFQAVYRQYRPMVKRSIAWLTRSARRVPYRGVAKNNAWWVTRAAGINLKRLLNHHDGTWALA